MQQKKPIGVILLSIYLLFYGVVTSVFMVILIAAFLSPQSQFSSNVLSNINKDAMHKTFWAGSLHEIPICIVYLFLATCALASGVGILFRQDWARIIIMIFASWDIIENIVNTIIIKQPLAGGVPWIIFDCVILFYLTRPKVRDRFI